MTVAREINFDALPGPTHNYAGLAYGNLASQRSRASISHPRAAALQGLAKMKLMADLGLRQAVLPPQPRPDLGMLRKLGFAGNGGDLLEAAHRAEPALLAACWSSSAMWAANTATVTPSADAADGKVHFTPANLISQFHRSLEAPLAVKMLRRVFSDERYFVHHPPLPAAAHFADEGAANHTRLCGDYGEPGVELFVYGRAAFDSDASLSCFAARQTREASMAIARLHRLDESRAVFARQNPAAIDAGVFHNDVISVGNQDVLLYHEQAFAQGARVMDELRGAFARTCGRELRLFEVSAREVPLADAVSSYLFNSQLVTLSDDAAGEGAGGKMALIAPMECWESRNIQDVIQRLLGSEGPLRTVQYVDLRQSMDNGGGPACVRLRVALRENEIQAVHPGVWLTEDLYKRLVSCVKRHYREDLQPNDLCDPALMEESDMALEAILEALQLRGLYS